jgi:hypothetical protein
MESLRSSSRKKAKQKRTVVKSRVLMVENRASLETMSFSSGALLVAVLSTAIVWLFCTVGPKDLRNLWIVVVPFAVSFCLYWIPVWFSRGGSDYDKAVLKSEYHNWELLFLVPWFFAGAIPSAAIVGVLAILRKRRAR